ncbi:MAG: ABC transporter permease [Acidobacteriota bacterium]
MTYAFRRLLLALPTLLGVSIVAFVLVALAPGDPALAVVGERATAAELEAERKRQGLDKPLPVRYLSWLGRVLTGDFGASAKTKRPVTEDLAVRWPATAELTCCALLLATLIGVAAGVTSATQRGSLPDQAAMATSLAGVSLPIFWLAGILLVVVTRFDPLWPTGFRLPTRLLNFEPVTGFYLLDSLMAGRFDVFGKALKHLVLPSIALGTIPMAIISRMTRSSMLEAMSQDYVRTARAKGLASFSVHYRHALRNALIPVVTIVGLQFGALLGGAIITEQVFSWPGLGNWILDGVNHRDQNVIQAGVLVIACGFVLINLFVDLLYSLLDPRLRAS